MELTQAELQVEEGQPTKDQHSKVWDENRTLSTCGTDPVEEEHLTTDKHS